MTPIQTIFVMVSIFSETLRFRCLGLENFHSVRILMQHFIVCIPIYISQWISLLLSNNLYMRHSEIPAFCKSYVAIYSYFKVLISISHMGHMLQLFYSKKTTLFSPDFGFLSHFRFPMFQKKKSDTFFSWCRQITSLNSYEMEVYTPVIVVKSGDSHFIFLLTGHIHNVWKKLHLKKISSLYIVNIRR